MNDVHTAAVTELSCTAEELAERVFIGTITVVQTAEIELATGRATVTSAHCAPGLS